MHGIREGDKQIMDIRQLRYFVKIIELGSLSRASKQLYVAQPALSQQVAKLEAMVGRPLLVRSSKGVTPTKHGTALYHHARLILRQVDQAISIAQSDAPAVSGMVSVGLPATTVAAIGLPLVKRVRERYPGILLNVVEGMSGHIEQMFQQNQLDLAVLFSCRRSETVSVEPLMVEELFLILRADSRHLPAGRRSVTLPEAAQAPLILPTARHGLRQRIAYEFENRGLGMNVVAEIDSLSLVMTSVNEDIGATIKPRGAVMQAGRTDRRWRCQPFSDAQLRRSNFLYALTGDFRTPAAAAVAAEIRDCVAELIEDHRYPGFEPAEAMDRSAA